MGFLRKIFGRDVEATTVANGRVITADSSVDSGLKWASPLPTPASAGQVIKSTGDTEGAYEWGVDNGAIDVIYPIGIVIEFGISVDPNLIWLGTTWIPTQEGRVSIGFQNGDATFGTLGSEGGASGHKMTLGNLIEHRHSSTAGADIGNGMGINNANGHPLAYDSSATTGFAGNADPEPIPTLPPYVVTAKWQRTA